VIGDGTFEGFPNARLVRFNMHVKPSGSFGEFFGEFGEPP